MVETAMVEERVAPLAARIAAREGCELVHCEYLNDCGRWYLRLYIDHEDGITIEECTSVSRQVSTVLDVEDFIPHAYNLEVSSPGLNRPLNTREDYRRFSGEPVRIRTASPILGRRRFRGILDEFKDDVVTVRIQRGGPLKFPLKRSIALA